MSELEELKREVEELKRIVNDIVVSRRLGELGREVDKLIEEENNGKGVNKAKVKLLESEVRRLADEVERGRKLYEAVVEIKTNLSNIEARVGKLEKAIYGDGSNEGLVYKMAQVESKIDNINKRTNLSLTFTVGTFVSIITTLVLFLVHH